MPEPPLSSPRKRQREEQHPLQFKGTSQHLPKKRKVSHPVSGFQTPAAFWDNLSKIWLTKRALRELERRNSQAALSLPRSSYRRRHRPVTRLGLAEWKKPRQPSQSAADFLCHCTSTCLKDIERFARHGGPDLSDLRGVCITRYLLGLELTTLSYSTRYLSILLTKR
jgi:hypothetical protein